MEIKHGDNLFILTVQCNLPEDDLPGEYVLGAFAEAAGAIAHFNELFGVYRPEKYIPFEGFAGDDDLLCADDPFPGITAAFIQRVQLNIIDDKFALMVLRKSLLATRAEKQKLLDQLAESKTPGDQAQ